MPYSVDKYRRGDNLYQQPQKSAESDSKSSKQPTQPEIGKMSFRQEADRFTSAYQMSEAITAKKLLERFRSMKNWQGTSTLIEVLQKDHWPDTLQKQGIKVNEFTLPLIRQMLKEINPPNPREYNPAVKNFNKTVVLEALKSKPDWLQDVEQDLRGGHVKVNGSTLDVLRESFGRITRDDLIQCNEQDLNANERRLQIIRRCLDTYSSTVRKSKDQHLGALSDVNQLFVALTGGRGGNPGDLPHPKVLMDLLETAEGRCKLQDEHINYDQGQYNELLLPNLPHDVYQRFFDEFRARIWDRPPIDQTAAVASFRRPPEATAPQQFTASHSGYGTESASTYSALEDTEQYQSCPFGEAEELAATLASSRQYPDHRTPDAPFEWPQTETDSRAASQRNVNDDVVDWDPNAPFGRSVGTNPDGEEHWRDVSVSARRLHTTLLDPLFKRSMETDPDGGEDWRDVSVHNPEPSEGFMSPHCMVVERPLYDVSDTDASDTGEAPEQSQASSPQKRAAEGSIQTSSSIRDLGADLGTTHLRRSNEKLRDSLKGSLFPIKYEENSSLLHDEVRKNLKVRLQRYNQYFPKRITVLYKHAAPPQMQLLQMTLEDFGKMVKCMVDDCNLRRQQERERVDRLRTDYNETSRQIASIDASIRANNQQINSHKGSIAGAVTRQQLKCNNRELNNRRKSITKDLRRGEIEAAERKVVNYGEEGIFWETALNTHKGSVEALLNAKKDLGESYQEERGILQQETHGIGIEELRRLRATQSQQKYRAKLMIRAQEEIDQKKRKDAQKTITKEIEKRRSRDQERRRKKKEEEERKKEKKR